MSDPLVEEARKARRAAENYDGGERRRLGHIEDLFNLVERAVKERDAARIWAEESVREVEARERVMTCVWCGKEWPPMTPPAQAPELLEHAKVCAKSPLGAAIARAEKAEAELAQLRKDLDDNETLWLMFMREHPVARAERRLAEDVAKMPKEPTK